MKMIRKLVYHLGFQPKPESIFFSPSLQMKYFINPAIKQSFEKFIEGGDAYESRGVTIVNDQRDDSKKEENNNAGG